MVVSMVRFVAGMAAAGDVDRSERWHQRFLRAVGDGLGHLAHVAIQIDAISFRIMLRRCEQLLLFPQQRPRGFQRHGSKRISSRGRSWPTLCRSAEITLAIFG